MNLTALFSLITVALNFAMMLWQNIKLTPEEATKRAIQALVDKMNLDISDINKALADNDGDKLTRKFEELRLEVGQATGAQNLQEPKE